MPRYVVDVRYKGTAYAGWQIQPDCTTVQGELDETLTKVLRTPISTYGAGRTDTGVHALQLPAHFDYDGELHPHFHKAINAILPKDIAINKVYKAVEGNFHARFSGIQRAYRYQLVFEKDPMHYQFARWIKEKRSSLNFEAMFAAAPILLEYDSFECFTKTRGNQKTHICAITHSYFEWEGDMLVYHIKANRFLRGMVRTIVGTLLMIGKGDLDEAGLRKIIEGKDRKAAGPAESADGLYLSEVVYPEGSLVELEFA